MLMMSMVKITDSATRHIVKMRYLPSSGITKDVAGIISMSTRKKKFSDRRIDTERVTFRGGKK